VCIGSLLTAFCIVLLLTCMEVDRLDPREGAPKRQICPRCGTPVAISYIRRQRARRTGSWTGKWPPRKTKGWSRAITTCNSRYINESALAAHLTVCLARNVNAGRDLVAPPGDTELAAPSALQVNSGPFKQLICAHADKLASRH